MSSRAKSIMRWLAGPERRRKVAAIAAAAIIVVASVAFLDLAHRVTFSDWDEADLFLDSMEGQENPAIDIKKYDVAVNKERLCCYVKVKGRLMGGEGGGAEGLQVFLDTDRDSKTGYQVYGIGADHMVAIHGWNGRVRSNTLRQWRGEGGLVPTNFEERSAVRYALRDDAMEVRVPLEDLGVSEKDAVRTVIRTVDHMGHEDWADAAVNQFPPALAFKYNGGQTSNTFALSATAHHENITLERIGIRFEDYRGMPADGRATIWGAGRTYWGTQGAVSQVTFTPPVTFAPGARFVLQVSTSLEGAVAVRPALLYSDDIQARAETTFPVEVSVKPPPSYAYVNTIAPPSGDIRIDGNFDDWQAFGIKGEPTDDVLMNHPDAPELPAFMDARNVDINGIQVKMIRTKINFLVMAVGHVLGGMCADTPQRSWMEGSIKRGPGDKPDGGRLADRVLIYVDVDPVMVLEEVTGKRLLEDWPFFGADCCVEVHGRSGRVLTERSGLYRHHEGEGWVRVKDRPISAATDHHSLEVTFPLKDMGLDPAVTPQVYIVATDCEGNYDTTEPYSNR